VSPGTETANASSRVPVEAVVVAAGSSRRMGGRDKLASDLAGRSGQGLVVEDVGLVVDDAVGVDGGAEGAAAGSDVSARYALRLASRR